MVTLLLVAVLMLVAAGAWSAHRRRQAEAWDRELLAAFDPGERREVSRRVL